MRFEWDHRKAKANLRKHGVSFDEACTVFDDPDAVLRFDSEHSNTEGEAIHMSKSEWISNPYFESLSKEITFRLDCRSLEYFQKLGEPYGLSAENMISRYLRHIAGSGYKANLGILTLKEREELEKSLRADGQLPLKG